MMFQYLLKVWITQVIHTHTYTHTHTRVYKSINVFYLIQEHMNELKQCYGGAVVCLNAHSAIGLRAEPQTDSDHRAERGTPRMSGKHVEHLQQNIWTR